jgi:Fur family peroxide stress response transcriptional regulator
MATHKHSKKRDAILECVRSTATHPSAEWVYAQLKPQIPDLSLGTVYRNLAMFKEEGLIGTMGVVAGNERFERNTEPHTHFICNHCSAVIDVEGLEPPMHLGSTIGCGIADACILTFTGTCSACAEKQTQSSSFPSSV